jgi:hypothetical protein
LCILLFFLDVIQMSKKGGMESPGVPCGRGTWEQVSSDIIGPDPLPGRSALTSFGRAVSLSHDGAIIAVGGPRAGAQVYDWDDGKWTQMGSDIKPGGGTFAVSLNKWGDRVAAGASRISTNGLTFNGAVKMYEYAGGVWTQLGNSIVGEADGEQIGEWEEALSLSEDGDTVAIGSFWKQVVRIYHFIDDTWSKIGDFVGSLNAGSYGFAVDLARNGRRLAISDPRAPFPGTQFRGQVIVYDYDSTSSWHQLGQVLCGDEDFDEFGQSVSLSAKGDILAVGADRSQNYMGLVKVFHYEKSSGLWEPLGQALIGDGTPRFGNSVSLSSDGMRLAVGGLQVYDFDGSHGVRSVRPWSATRIPPTLALLCPYLVMGNESPLVLPVPLGSLPECSH